MMEVNCFHIIPEVKTRFKGQDVWSFLKLLLDLLINLLPPVSQQERHSCKRKENIITPLFQWRLCHLALVLYSLPCPQITQRIN